MAARVIHRPARTRVDPLPKKPLEISAPPVLEANTAPQEGMTIRVAMPILAGGGMMLMMASSGSMLRMIAGLGFVAVAVLMGVSMYIYSKTGNRKRMEMKRTAYLKFLKRVDAAAIDEIALQRQVQERLHPPPGALFNVIDNPARVYERRSYDADFAVTRIGVGPGPLARGVQVERVHDPAAEMDAISAAHLERTRRVVEHIDNLPLTVPLAGAVSVVGDPGSCQAVLRAALTQLMVMHAPEDVVIHLCLGRNLVDYHWLLHAPHVYDADQFDGPVHRRRVSTSHLELVDLLKPTLDERAAVIVANKSASALPPATPLIVVVIDRDDNNGQPLFGLLPPGITMEALGVCFVHMARRRIDEPSEVTCRVEVAEDGRVTVDEPDAVEDDQKSARDPATRARRLAAGARRGSLDHVDVALATAIANELAPIRLAPESAPEAPLASTFSIETLLGVDDVGTFDPVEHWQPRGVADFLRVPFGVDTEGRPVLLDLKESALDGHGPHGLCIGATGSGKSEVLRTLVMAQAIRHSPDRLAFVLVDYKGGAAFHGLEILPHTAAIVDNLGDDEGLVDRLHDALTGELRRRQRVLQAAEAKNIFDYNDRRDAGAGLDPLPNLFVVIDEFGEILVQKPEFVDLFVQIGRIGRSIGIHLLLASQRLEEGRLRGLESHLSYRIALRTFSAIESKAVIGKNDAHTLPAIPGSGYLKVDPDIYTRFKAAYVSGRYESGDERVTVDLPPIAIPHTLTNKASVWVEMQQRVLESPLQQQGESDRSQTPFDDIVLQVAARRLASSGHKVPQIWLPPLPHELGFGSVTGELATTEARGLQVADPEQRGTLQFPIGVLDDPVRQWQGTFTAETTDANIVIIGAPQTGKSTTIRTMVCGAAVTHTPAETAWYLIDAGGSTLSDLGALPHVGGVATRFDPDRIRRTVAEMVAELSRREALFSRHRISTARHMRTLVAQGDIELDGVDRYLVIDGFASFVTEFEDLVADVTDLAVRGLGYGLHVIITANRVGDMRLNLHTSFAVTIEHRLNTAIDSTIDRVMQQRIGRDRRGMVLSQSGKLAQIANTDASNCADLIAEVTSAWQGNAVPPVRMLPTRITHAEIVAQAGEGFPVLLGVDEATLSPVRVDLMRGEPHLMVLGDTESGKTTLLRTVIGDLVSHHDPNSLNIVVIDPRRTLLDFTPEPPLKVYASSAERAEVIFTQLHDYLAKRLPGPEVTTDQLRERNWWTGPEMVVVIDDYDILVPSAMAANPIDPHRKLVT